MTALRVVETTTTPHQAAGAATSAWWMETATTKAALKSFMKVPGERSATTIGMRWMRRWSATNWGCLLASQSPSRTQHSAKVTVLSGWTTSPAPEVNRVFKTAHTLAGVSRTAHTARMQAFAATDICQLQLLPSPCRVLLSNPVTFRRILFAFLLAANSAFALPAQAEVDSTQRYVLDIQGMTCNGCASTVHEALLSSKGISAAVVSHLQGKACIEADDNFDAAIVSAALTAVEYKMTAHLSVEACPDGLTGKLPEPWEEHSQGLRVKTVSQGEEIDLTAQIVDGSYTIIDFGAPWCGPCHEAAEQLAAYLKEHADVAVRAINLAGQEPAESYQQPIVAQHLQYVKGVPWFIIHAPGGKVLYKGMEVSKVMKAIDKHRKRAAKKAK